MSSSICERRDNLGLKNIRFLSCRNDSKPTGSGLGDDDEWQLCGWDKQKCDVEIMRDFYSWGNRGPIKSSVTFYPTSLDFRSKLWTPMYVRIHLYFSSEETLHDLQIHSKDTSYSWAFLQFDRKLHSPSSTNIKYQVFFHREIFNLKWNHLINKKVEIAEWLPRTAHAYFIDLERIWFRSFLCTLALKNLSVTWIYLFRSSCRNVEINGRSEWFDASSDLQKDRKTWYPYYCEFWEEFQFPVPFVWNRIFYLNQWIQFASLCFAHMHGNWSVSSRQTCIDLRHPLMARRW